MVLCRQAQSVALASGVLGVLVTGCMAEAHAPDGRAEVAARAGALIGGVEADSPKLNAVGSISRVAVPEGDVDVDAGVGPGDVGLRLVMACSGALLNDRTVLTAKHCLDAFNVAGQTGDHLVFALGPDALRPSRYSQVIDVEGAAGGMQGFTGNGFDVAVLHLRDPLEGVAPVKLGTLDDMQIGQGFAAVGYGRPDNHDEGDKRRLGSVSLRALEGKTYELLLGSFDEYFKRLRGVAVPMQCVNPTPEAANSDSCKLVAQDRNTYETTMLEQSGDMLVGGDATGSQPCFGDSGGPLLRANDQGDLVAYGVVSGGLGSDELICDRGVIYARFVPEVMSFLEQSLSWQDPCRTLPAAGECVGERARRCSSVSEGKRRVVEADCSALGLHCSVTREGPTCE